MSVAFAARLLLRLAHALAAALWLGGGAYYATILRPQLRGSDPAKQAVAKNIQREFGEWASTLTLVMIATGVVLSFDRLTDGRGTTVYVALLAAKIVAALLAFWLSGSLAGRVTGARPRRAGAGPRRINRSAVILLLGTAAFVLGVALSSIYPSGIGQR